MMGVLEIPHSNPSSAASSLVLQLPTERPQSGLGSSAVRGEPGGWKLVRTTGATSFPPPSAPTKGSTVVVVSGRPRAAAGSGVMVLGGDAGVAGVSRVVERIKSARRRYGWQGKGSHAVTRGACEAAARFALATAVLLPNLALPRVSPSPVGGVLLSWRFGDLGFSVRFRSKDPSAVEYQWSDADFEHGQGKGTDTEIRDRLGRLMVRANGHG